MICVLLEIFSRRWLVHHQSRDRWPQRPPLRAGPSSPRRLQMDPPASTFKFSRRPIHCSTEAPPTAVMNDCIGIPSANGSAFFRSKREKSHSLLASFLPVAEQVELALPRILIVQQRIHVVDCTTSLLECQMI